MDFMQPIQEMITEYPIAGTLIAVVLLIAYMIASKAVK